MLHFLLNYAILMWFYVKHIQAHHILSDNFRFKNREYLKFSTLCYTLFLYLLYKGCFTNLMEKRQNLCHWERRPALQLDFYHHSLLKYH